MSEVGVVVWKELRETLLRRGRPSWPVLGMVGVALFLGLVLPASLSLLTPPAQRLELLGLLRVLIPLSEPFLAFFGVGYVVIDAVAGEKERNTMPTLLATPLGDAAILFGKLIPVLAIPVANLVLLNVLGILTLEFLYGPHYTPPWSLIVGAFVVGVLVAILAAGIGLLIAMASSNVRQGQQVLGYLMVPLPVLFFILPNYGIGLMRDAVGFAAPAVVALVWFAGYLVVVAALYAAALRLFNRDRLMRA